MLDHGYNVMLFSCHVCMDFGMATYVMWDRYNCDRYITTETGARASVILATVVAVLIAIYVLA